MLSDTSVFTPHGYCLAWDPTVLWLHVGSDATIAFAYYSIPLALAYFVHRRRDLAYKWVFGLFAMFIFACGTTHLFGIWTLWQPDYVTEGLIKFATAAVSVGTAFALWPLLPSALALPSPAALRSEVTERRRAEEELTLLNRDLEQRVATRTAELQRRNEQLEQFAYVVSHDVKEPLRMINSYLQLVQRRYGASLDADAQEFLGYAHEGGERLQDMVDGLLNYARLDAEAARTEAVKLGEVVPAAWQAVGAMVADAGGTLECDALPTVAGDRIQLGQLFQNLFANAIKYRSGQPPRIQVTAEPDGERWRIGVHDNGIGVPAEGRQRIFGLFQRLHTREEYPGSGMGLAICHNIVDRHGGRIWVEDGEGGGSVFRLTLPAMAATADAAGVPA